MRFKRRQMVITFVWIRRFWVVSPYISNHWSQLYCEAEPDIVQQTDCHRIHGMVPRSNLVVPSFILTYTQANIIHQGIHKTSLKQLSRWRLTMSWSDMLSLRNTFSLLSMLPNWWFWCIRETLRMCLWTKYEHPKRFQMS